MAEKDADLVDPFFDSEEDEVPVDMEMVFEAMKHVPLPDLDYHEQDDPISVDHSFAEPLSATVIRAQPDPALPQGILKRKVDTVEIGQPRKKGGGVIRISNRLKAEVQGNGFRSKISPKQSFKVEDVVSSITAAAAKVAAEVAPNIVTGGIVAETGPRPDFSFWTVEDDLLLKNAMEAGAAMEALAKGAMRFSRRFTVRELRERWRALLYDPEIAAQAAARMAEVEYGSSYSLPKSPKGQKNPLERARKRRANSIRTLYYKRSKKAGVEDVDPAGSHGLGESDMVSAHAASNGLAVDVPGIRPLLDIMAVGSVDTGSGSPKEATSLDLEDRTFSQMFSLLAAGGVRAVIGAIPAGLAVDLQDQDMGVPLVCGNIGERNLPQNGGLFELVDSRGEAGVLGTGFGLVPHSGSISEKSLETANAGTRGAECMEMLTNPTFLVHDCQNLEDGATFGVVDSEIHTDMQPTRGQESITVSETYEMQGAINGDFEDHYPGLHPISVGDLDQTDVSGINTISDNRLVGGVETPVTEYVNVKDDCPCETSFVSGGNQCKGLHADIKLLYPSPKAMVDTSNLEAIERSPWSNIGDQVDVEMEDADRVEDVCTECCYRDDCSVDGCAERGYCCSCDETENGDRCCLDDSCIHNVVCGYGKGGCELSISKVAPSVLEPFVCTLNTEDTEIPSLDDALLSSPSLPSSPSDQGEYLGCTDGAFGDTDADGYAGNFADPEVDVDADDDDDGYVESSPRLGVASIKVEPDSIGSFCDPMDGGELASSVERDGKIGINSINAVANLQEQRSGFKGADPLTNPVVSTVPTCVSEGVSCLLSSVGKLQRQSVPQVEVDGSLQVLNTFRVTELQMSTTPTVSSVPHLCSRQVDLAKGTQGEMNNTEPEPSPIGDVPVVIPSSDQILTGAEVHKLLQESVEEELESDEEMPRFSDIEAMILDMDLDVADDDFSARAESRRMYRRHGRAFLRSEQAATAAMQRTLNVHGAFATLYGRHLKYYIRQTEVLVGRATSDNTVDIDLGKEGRANKVSRQQANIKLKDDGIFYLRNLGRRGLTVNNKPVETGQRAILGSNCLIEVGGMRFIFETNRKLVKEHMERRHQPQ